jgi:hypothetical protein
MADNNKSNEIIFPGYFSMVYLHKLMVEQHFLTHSTIGGDAMSALDSSYFGVQFWLGRKIVQTPEFAEKLPG